MSCTDDGPPMEETTEETVEPTVERAIELPAPPDEVWEALPSILGDDVELVAEPGGRLRARGPDGEHVGVVEAADAPRRLAFWWVPADGDGSPSMVELELTAIELGSRELDTVAVGTLLHVRETRFDPTATVVGLRRGPLARARA